ncbi:unnamed protein product [Sphagnum balticum]
MYVTKTSSNNGVKIGAGIGVSLGVVFFALVTAFFFWRRNKKRQTQQIANAVGDPDRYVYNPQETIEQDRKFFTTGTATGRTSENSIRTPTENYPPPAPPVSHELHNQSQAYEMSEQHALHYELQGSQSYRS